MKNYLKKGLEKLDIKLSEDIQNKLMSFFEYLVEINKMTNLTAIRDEKEIIEKHFLDSLMILPQIPDNIKKAIDIGTGAGFPGMVLAIARPEITFTLLDSVGKKTQFLEEVKEKLKMENVWVVNQRAEEFIKSENQRESYDLGLCRGVSQMNVILEYMLPFLKNGGVFLPQKLNYEKELENSENCLNILKSEIQDVVKLELPFSKDARVILKIIKKDTIDKKYPRRIGIPKKRPL